MENQKMLLDYLIEYLLNENTKISVNEIPDDINEKKNLWRSLCNIREPKEISEKYLQIEKEYLQEELKKKKITKAEDINQVCENINDKIYLWKGDITTISIDAIVNAANSGGLRLFCSLP